MSSNAFLVLLGIGAVGSSIAIIAAVIWIGVTVAKSAWGG